MSNTKIKNKDSMDSKAIIDGLSEFDPATVYEAAGLEGMIDPDLKPAWKGKGNGIFGVAATVKCPPGDNLMVHLAVAKAKPGSVIVVDACEYVKAGYWGEVLTVAAQSRGISGLVIDGAVRDIEEIAELKFPVFSRGLAIGSCSKRNKGELDVPIQIGKATIRSGDIILGNSDGLVVVERERSEEVFRAAVERRNKEAKLINCALYERKLIHTLKHLFYQM